MNRLAKIEMMRDVITGTGGKFFSVDFVKKDGTDRHMSCKDGVIKYLSGGEYTKGHMPQYIATYDMVAQAYRTINLETLKKFKCGDLEITFAE